MGGHHGVPSSASRPNRFEGQSNVRKDIANDRLVFSFRYLDVNQGQSFDDWQQTQILAQALHTLKDYSNQKVPQAYTGNDRFKCYQSFPPKQKTEFVHPKHVPEDAVWASMHVQGKICIIGHVHLNIFYVVFLDQQHHFWKSELQERGKKKKK